MTLAPPCFNIGTAPMDLKRLQKLPVEAKAIYSKMIIQRFYIQERGKVYVSYSGAKIPPYFCISSDRCIQRFPLCSPIQDWSFRRYAISSAQHPA